MISSSFLIQTKTMVYCSQVVDFQQNVSVKNLSSLDQILNQIKLRNQYYFLTKTCLAPAFENNYYEQCIPVYHIYESKKPRKKIQTV